MLIKSNACKFLVTFAAIPLLAVVACGGDEDGNGGGEPDAFSCALETRADEFVAGMEKLGLGGARVVLVSSDPSPPARNDNTWTLQIQNEVGDPLEGATVDLVPFMPDHQHGTPIRAEITDMGGGAYEAAPVNLWMPGLWEVTVSVDDGAGFADEVVFAFCIDG
jgi:hypothetical protein